MKELDWSLRIAHGDHVFTLCKNCKQTSIIAQKRLGYGVLIYDVRRHIATKHIKK